MKQYEIGKAVVRIHGNPNRDKIESAMVRFLKQAEIQKKKKAKST